MISTDILKKVSTLLFDGGHINHKEYQSYDSFLRIEPVTADGSLRNFFRVISKTGPLCVGVSPHSDSPEDLSEAKSVIDIGRHLYSKGIPVPEILASDRTSGIILFEDCGNVRLHDLLNIGQNNETIISEDIESIYYDLITELVHMQIAGRVDFQTSWCCDTAYYDHNIMIKKESEYFLNAFYYELMSGDKCYDINEEFKDIARHAAIGMLPTFLHRDFQCRNIMVVSGKIRIIDFQGGRLGPPGYDLASLLIDPYSNLPVSFQEKLLNHYLITMLSQKHFETKDFLDQYYYLSLQRNLQILGAFSFLSIHRGKNFFKDYITPALLSLSNTLHRPGLCNYPILSKIVNESLVRIKQVL